MTRPFYSVTFGNKNTWDEWALMPVKEGKIEFVTPEVKAISVDVAGADQALDLTEALTGYPNYYNRKGTLSFRFFDNGVPVRIRFNKLKNYLHGKKMTAIIVDEPDFYYVGRFTVGDLEFAKKGNWGDVTISYNVGAYKNDIVASDEPWLWDPFNFETGVIRNYQKIILEYQNTPVVESVTVIGSPKPVPLKVTISVPPIASEYASWAYVKMQYGEDIYYLRAGTKIFPNIMLLDDEYEFEFSLLADPDTGNALAEVYLTIEYRGGSL